MSTSITERSVETEVRADLAQIEEHVITNVHLADLLRRGAENTVQSVGWGQGAQACFLSASALAARDLGYIQ